MAAYILRRMLSTIAVMVMVGTFIFLLVRLSPGDPSAIIAGDAAPPQMMVGVREKLGLDDPLPIQFLHWAVGILGGDFGHSIFTARPVLGFISQRLEPTISLPLLTMIVSVVAGGAFGMLAAWRFGGVVDCTLAAFAAIGFSVPVFVIGYFLIYWFAISAHWLPVQGYQPIDNGLRPWLVHLILLTIALSFPDIAYFARITRASMLEVLSENYMRTAAAQGASSCSMLFHHALKNAGVLILTVIGISFAYLISGVVVTGTVFSIPDVGLLMVDAINNRDYPIIQGVLILASALYVLINLAVDLAYALIDPRIRY
ncbi:peptide ABC transporter [Bradyrhizobium japonicum]|uniref:Peptide ABC transporter n=1 Tax=Bradyrhizobium japonicum TaxID=375 RepID=A0A0A3XJ07_BRAJP|nr:ABC transporter permease [Bradyrhizobium japonicum]KGT73254.1 peptide ABC transporter [Bradyrhizobium japonicum]